MKAKGYAVEDIAEIIDLTVAEIEGLYLQERRLPMPLNRMLNQARADFINKQHTSKYEKPNYDFNALSHGNSSLGTRRQNARYMVRKTECIRNRTDAGVPS